VQDRADRLDPLAEADRHRLPALLPEKRRRMLASPFAFFRGTDPGRPAMSVRRHYARLDLGRRVALRALAAFLVTFAVLRIITAIIHFELLPHGPFRNLVTRSGLHIHHLFWGALLLMISEFAALATRAPVWHLRIAIVYGVAMALMLDEFALWLRLADVYWSPQGIESIKAGAVAAAILAIYGFGQPFWHAIAKDAVGRKRRTSQRSS
jgi:Uncharacterized protein conserved in bacteria (DUF2252)